MGVPIHDLAPYQTAAKEFSVTAASSTDSVLLGHGPVIVVAAALAEAGAIARALHVPAPEVEWRQVSLGSRWSLACCGVGKANAAMCVGRGLKGMDEAGAVVLNLGICGGLPAEGGSPLVGSVVVGEASVYADEGILTPRGFLDMASQGFPYWAGAETGASGQGLGRAGGTGGCTMVAANTALVERVAAGMEGRVGATVRTGAESRRYLLARGRTVWRGR